MICLFIISFPTDRRAFIVRRFAVLELKVAVNHGGSVITDEPIDFDNRGFIIFTEATEPNFTGENLTLGEYVRGEFEQDEDEELQFGGMRL